MPMTKEQIAFAIQDRLADRWRRRMTEEDAAPVCVIGIKQLAGPGYATPVLCCTEDMPNDQLADLLLGVSRMLRRQR